MKKLILLLLLVLSVVPVLPTSSHSSPDHGTLLLQEQENVQMSIFQSNLNVTMSSIPSQEGYRIEYPVDGIEAVFDVFVASNQLVWFSVLDDNQIWSLNRSSSEIRSYLLPANVTPFLIKEDTDGSLWFTDYDFSPFNHYDGVVHFDPVTLNVTVYQLNIPKTGPFDLLLTGGKVWFTQWISGVAARLDPETGQLSTVKFDNNKYSDLPCGPVGLTQVKNGKIWVVETLCSILVEMDPSDMSYTLFRLPSDFYSPVFVQEDSEGQLWTADHAGNRVLKFDPLTGEYETVLVVPPVGGVWGFAGINEVDLDSQGRLWFAEHFINRVGFYDTINELMYEFVLPQPDPLIQWIDINGTDLWYGVYTEGILGLIEGDRLPKVNIELEQEYSIGRVGRFSVPMEVSVSKDLIGRSARSFADSEDRDQIFGTGSITKTIPQSGNFSTRISVNIGNNIELGTYHAVVGLDIQGLLITKQLTIDVQENLFFTVFIQGMGPVVLVYLVGFYKRDHKK